MNRLLYQTLDCTHFPTWAPEVQAYFILLSALYAYLWAAIVLLVATVKAL